MSKSNQSIFQFVATVAIICLIWLVILPGIGSNKVLRHEIDFLDERGVDPSALYYSDLPGMSAIQKKVDQKRKENPQAFWGRFASN